MECFVFPFPLLRSCHHVFFAAPSLRKLLANGDVSLHPEYLADLDSDQKFARSVAVTDGLTGDKDTVLEVCVRRVTTSKTWSPHCLVISDTVQTTTLD